MRKAICIILIAILLTTITNNYLVSGYNVSNELSVKNSLNEDKILKDISNKLIRFHVIANSDTVEDQNLKLRVKDKVLEYISPKLKVAKTLNESRDILKKNDKAINLLVQKMLKDNGYTYSVSTELSIENFPIKSYGIITLPQGSYEAYRIIIGNGKGQNWWCVMFPPLCFIDITKQEVSKKETEVQMKRVLSDDEYKTINNEQTSALSNGKNTKFKFKFKFVEIIKDLKNKLDKYNKDKDNKDKQLLAQTKKTT